MNRLKRWQLLRCIDGPIQIDNRKLAEVERRLRERVRKDRKLTTQSCVGAILMGFSGFAGQFAWMYSDLGDLSLWHLPIMLGIQAISMGIVVFAWHLFLSPKFHRHARRAFADCGFPVCTKCGYLLDGLEELCACPECGENTEDAAPDATDRDS